MNILHFAAVVGKLKRLPRAGWIVKKIKNPESVAEHSYRVAMLAMALAPSFKVNQNKVIKMALIHDLAESEIGDVITQIGAKVLPNRQEKVQAEREAMLKISSDVENKELLELFDEYEANKTDEAQFVKQLDKLEMAIQAHEYELDHYEGLEEFFITAQGDVIDEGLKLILKDLDKLRRKISD